MSKDIGYSQSSEVADFNESLQNDASQRTSKTLSHSRLGQTKRVNKSRSNHTNFPGYSCFPSATGQLAQAPRRSALSQERRNEVKQIRHRGACLRCRFRKIPCSGDDPCKSCLSLAQAKLGSRALMWMECIRTSFKAVSIFEKGDFGGHIVNLDEIKRDILGQDDTPVVKAPFELTLESTTKYLIEWIIEGSNYSTFSIAGLLRSDEFRKILTSTLGSNMSEKFRLMIYLTNDVTTRGEKNAYLGYNATILHTLSHYAGHMVLNAVESRLRPVALAASRTKLNDLQAIFLVLFGISITARYSYLDTLLRGQPTNPGTKRRAEGFIRLVNHYIVYISGLINHMDVASRNSLLTTCEFQWDKPGSSVSSLTSDCLDKGSGTYFDKPGGKYVDMLESAAIQESVNCGTSGHLRGILDYHCRCQKCQLDFDALGLGTIIEGQIERSVPPYSSNGEYQAVSHQTELSSSLQHEELSIIGRYYSWGEVPGKFSALITSPSARRKLLQKSESGTGTPRKPLEYGVKLANWVESTKNNFVQEPCSEEKGEEEPPAYWTFFNQNQQFEIYRNVNKCTFTNNPEQIDLANESKRGPPEEYPKPGFGQTHSASALEWERISKSQPIICSGYNTFMGPVPWENVIMCPFGSSLPLAPALTQPECLWCDKTASTYNSNNLCDECNNLLNP